MCASSANTYLYLSCWCYILFSFSILSVEKVKFFAFNHETLSLNSICLFMDEFSHAALISCRFIMPIKYLSLWNKEVTDRDFFKKVFPSLHLCFCLQSCLTISVRIICPDEVTAAPYARCDGWDEILGP